MEKRRVREKNGSEKERVESLESGTPEYSRKKSDSKRVGRNGINTSRVFPGGIS